MGINHSISASAVFGDFYRFVPRNGPWPSEYCMQPRLDVSEPGMMNDLADTSYVQQIISVSHIMPKLTSSSVSKGCVQSAAVYSPDALTHTQPTANQGRAVRSSTDASTMMRRPLAPGRYNVTFFLKGFANETRTVDVPEDGTGVKLAVYLELVGDSVLNWGLARKLGPLNSMRPAGDGSQVRLAHPCH